MYGTCEIDWAKANFSTIYKSYIISIFICCFFLPVTVMVFSYVSIINTVKLSHALTGLGDPTDRQRRIERDVTRVSLCFMLCRIFFGEIYLSKNWSQLEHKRGKNQNSCFAFLYNLYQQSLNSVKNMRFVENYPVTWLILVLHHMKNNLNIIGVIQHKTKIWFGICSFLSEVTILPSTHRSYGGAFNLLIIDISLPKTFWIHINKQGSVIIFISLDDTLLKHITMPKFDIQLLRLPGFIKSTLFLACILLWAMHSGQSEHFPSSEVSKLLSPVYLFPDVAFQNKFKTVFLLVFRFLSWFAQPSLLHGHHMLSSLYGLPMVTLCPILPASSPVCLLSLPASTIPLSTLEWAPNFGGTFSSCSIVPRKSRTL